MKLGTENRTKTIVAAVLGVLAIFLLVRAFTGGDDNPAPQTTTTSAPAAAKAATPSALPKRTGTTASRNAPHPLLAQTLDPTLRFDLLKASESVTYKGSGRDIFRSQAPPPDIPKVITTPITPGPPPPAPPPPINLKFYGFASRKNGEGKKIFLASGDDIFVAKEGDIVNRRYRIVKINNNSVDVEDVLTNNRQTLPLVVT